MNPAGRALILRGRAEQLPLPDASVDLIVTSPPYFGLRSYTDGGVHYAGQVGSEATPAEFLDALIACTAEWIRVLKPSGSIWVNLGDKYSGSDGGGGYSAKSTLAGFTSPETKGRKMQDQLRRRFTTDVKPKSLLGLPWRYAIRCIDELGLILRAEVIWSKPNGLPESVTDRVRRSHEQWFHFTALPHYFSAVDEIRECYAPGTVDRYKSGYDAVGYALKAQTTVGSVRHEDGGPASVNPLGKLPGSVWTIASEPLRVPEHLGVDHFAAFPTEWPRRIIRGWSPAAICTACGQGRRPIRRSVKLTARPGCDVRDQRMPGRHATGNQGREGRAGDYETSISGYACDCPDTTAPGRPAVVLDPFGGTGTTALVASVLGRTGISVDLSHDYCRLARWRTSSRKERDKAARARRRPGPKPVRPVDGQAAMFPLPKTAP